MRTAQHNEWVMEPCRPRRSPKTFDVFPLVFGIMITTWWNNTKSSISKELWYIVKVMIEHINIWWSTYRRKSVLHFNAVVPMVWIRRDGHVGRWRKFENPTSESIELPSDFAEKTNILFEFYSIWTTCVEGSTVLQFFRLPSIKLTRLDKPIQYSTFWIIKIYFVTLSTARCIQRNTFEYPPSNRKSLYTVNYSWVSFAPVSSPSSSTCKATSWFSSASACSLTASSGGWYGSRPNCFWKWINWSLRVCSCSLSMYM